MATRFHALVSISTPLVFSHFEALADTQKPGFYAGVLVIQKGIAKGHYAVKDPEAGRLVNYNPNNPAHAELRKYQITIGDETLDDVTRCGVEAQETKCKLDHGATIKDIVGDYTGFRRDGDQVRADLTLMDETPHRGFVMELFAKYAKKVGNSIDFDFRYDLQGDVAVARCVKLNSVDIVDAPAATNSLFNENQQPPNHMALSKEDLEQIGNVVNTAVDAKFTALQSGIETRLGKIETTVTKLEEGEEDDDKKEELEEEDDKKEDGKESMAAVVEKATLAAVQKLLPKAALESLANIASGGNGNTKDEYADKLALCESAGITGPRAVRHIAAKWPAIYTAKFGNGGGGKGSAKTTL